MYGKQLFSFTRPVSNKGNMCATFNGVGYHPPFSTQWTSPAAMHSSSY